MILMGAFFFGATAYAGATPDLSPTPNKEDGFPENDLPFEVTPESLFPTPTERPDFHEPPPQETVPPTPTPSPSNPFTPDGQGTVVDHATNDDGKEFFTFRTPAGNVFFLVIDHQRAGDNVYFLNAVTELDLLALAEQAGDNPFAPPMAPMPMPTPDPLPELEPVEPDEVDPAPAPSGNNGTMIFVFFAALTFGAAGYYIKIVRPKKQAAELEDEYEDEDEGEEMEFEDEVDEEDE